MKHFIPCTKNKHGQVWQLMLDVFRILFLILTILYFLNTYTSTYTLLLVKAIALYAIKMKFEPNFTCLRGK